MTDRLAATLALDAPSTSLSGISGARSAALAAMGMTTVRDIVQHYPRRYVDMSRIMHIADTRLGETCTVVGEVYAVNVKRPRPRLSIVEVTVVDQTGTLIASFFGQPWLAKKLTPGTRVSVAGTVEFNYGHLRMTSPYVDVLEEHEVLTTGTIYPVHPASAKVSTSVMRTIEKTALDAIDGCYDPIPVALRRKYLLMSRSRALRAIHFPHTMEEVAQAKRRLVYEELLLLELDLQSTARDDHGETPHRAVLDGPRLRDLRDALTFKLTDDQERAISDITGLMATPQKMSHLLLGDVGTGKTMVAAFAIAAAADARYQTMMMAPTETLARQYGLALGPLFEKAGVTFATLTATTAPDERARILSGFGSGDIDVLFGTHALLQPDVVGHDVGLVVIDEQQRFGVDQRTQIMEKGEGVDALFLTATPIPRSLALALYGGLTLSYLKQAPAHQPGRTTRVVNFRNRGQAYDAAVAACRRGEQVYVVCPLVASAQEKARRKDGEKAHAAQGGRKGSSADGRRRSDEDDDETSGIVIEDDRDFTDTDTKAAEDHAAFLQDKVFSEYTVGLLHGKLSAHDKQETMDRFRSGEIDVLVCTTVIEVGVDVPNATCMIVEDADRFGLAQLHQLRGRVGRGSLPGEVYLIDTGVAADGAQRLAAMEKTDDGFELAEFDLSMRKEGDILGNRQHGASTLKLVNVARDGAVIEAAHDDAARLLDQDPDQTTPELKVLMQECRRTFPQSNDHATLGG